MQAHIKYLQYVLTHKWYVFLASFEVGLPIWRAILHDWDKFKPSAWKAYVNYFYEKDGSRRAHREAGLDFQYAWLNHQKNKHHWQAWVSVSAKGQYSPLPMPEIYVREMIADWIGAGMAISGKRDFKEFYVKNLPSMLLHSKTKETINSIMEELK